MSGNDEFVERLVVGVSYKTDKDSLRGVMGEFRGAFDMLTGFAGGLLSAAIAGAVFAVSQAAAMDDVADFAAQIRTTTEDLTAYQYVATQSGMATDEFDMAMVALDRSLANASDSASPAAKALHRLGLSTRDADGRVRDAVGSIDDIADALLRVPEGERGAIMLDLFGRQAAKMRPLLERGKEGIADLREEAQRLGLVLSTESAAAAGELTDNIAGLRGAVRGLGWQIADTLIPPMSEAVEGLTDWLLVEDGIVQGGLDKFLGGLRWTLHQLETPLGKSVAGVIALAGGVGLLRAGSEIPVIGGMLRSLGPLAARAGLAGLAVAGVALAIDDIIVTAEGGDSVIRRFAEALGVGEEAERTFAEGGSMLLEAAKALGIIIPELASATGTLLVDSFNAAAAEAKMLAEALGVPEDVLERMAALIERVTTGLSGLKFLPDLFAEAGQGFSEFTRFASGDQSVQLSSPIDVLNPGFTGDLIRTTAGDRLAADRAAGVSVGGVVVNTAPGATREEMADAASRAVYAEIMRSTEAVDGLR